MKHKVGDKVRIKSKEWWNAQPKSIFGNVICSGIPFHKEMSKICGNVVEISEVHELGYKIKEYNYFLTDEMFEDDEPAKEENSLFKAIIEAAKQQPLLVEKTEDGGVKISPLKAEEEDDLPIDTPVMVMDKTNICWNLRYYACKGRVFVNGNKSENGDRTAKFDYIVPCDKFNFENPEESLKYNIVK